jgi:hypothetical protein
MYTTDDELSEEQVHDAVQLLIDAAEDGLPVAQYNLGVLFKTGQWLDRDMEQSLAWTVESAIGGYLAGQISSGDMFYDAAIREENQGPRQILLENSEYWLRMSLEQSDIDEASRLYAQMLLSRTLNFETLLNEDAWLLMLDAACEGQPVARVLLEHNTNIIRQWVADGNEEAVTVLEIINSYDRSKCDAAQ